MAKIQQIEENLYVFRPDNRSRADLGLAAKSLFHLGVEAMEASRLDDALACFQKSLELKTNYADALVNIGTIFYRRQDWKNAEKNYRKAVELDPRYPKAHFNLGNICDELGNHKEAEQHYLQALKLDSKYGDAHFNIALLYAKMGRIQRAIEHHRAHLRCGEDSAFWQDISMNQIKRLKEEQRKQSELLRIIPKTADIQTQTAAPTEHQTSA